MQPLIDDLKLLWEEGVNTFDSFTKQNFRMRAIVLWTINDFPAYGNLSGWSTKGLTVHLAQEARIAGPVQYRWMYPVERYLLIPL